LALRIIRCGATVLVASDYEQTLGDADVEWHGSFWHKAEQTRYPIVGTRALREDPMRGFLVRMAAAYLVVGGAIAQPASTSSPSLSIDQQNKISEIVTNRTLQPLTHINFALQRDALIPPEVQIQRLPAEAENVAPELKGYSYLAVEELVAIVDTNSRKVVSVMQRMRRQENTGSGH
jgi:hypothetical protein